MVLQKAIFRTCLIFNFFLQLTFVQAQTEQIPVLEREVNISARNQTIEWVINQISAQSGIIFSYSPEIIGADSEVDLSVQDKSVRFTLNLLFSNDIAYKVKGEYIILKKESNKNKNTPNRTIEGYIYDSGTGEKLTGASVYDENLTSSAVTDNYGYFRLELPKDMLLSSIRASKAGYNDTTSLPVKNNSLRTLEISLESDKSNKKTYSSAFQKIAPVWLVPRQTLLNSINIKKSVFKAVQFSFLPTISTNHFLRGNSVNYVSINLLAGYVQGVRIAEIGGLVNIVKENVQYAQFGGIGNIVGNDFRGFQAGGIFNTARSVNGVQTAGIFNNSITNADFQISGIYNHTLTGISQTAGILNISNEMKLQIAGIANTAEKSAFQLAGIVNSAHVSTGLQLAGIINYTSDSAEIQISGLLNRAAYIHTLQLSVINLADSCSGVSVGLFSFIKKGYHKVEISADEVFPFNASFRSGTKQFHTLVMVGTNPFKSTGTCFHYGYGIGTSFGKMRKMLLDIDFINREVFNKNNSPFNSHLFEVYAGFDKPLFSKMSVAAGLTYNYLLSDESQADNSLSASLPPYEISTNSFPGGYFGKSWFGARLSIRFF